MIYLDSAEQIALDHLRWAKERYQTGERRIVTPLSKTEVFALVGLYDRLMKEKDNDLDQANTGTDDEPKRARDLSFMREPHQQLKNKKHR